MDACFTVNLADEEDYERTVAFEQPKKTARPMPRAASVDDFITNKSFAALIETQFQRTAGRRSAMTKGGKANKSLIQHSFEKCTVTICRDTN